MDMSRYKQTSSNRKKIHNEQLPSSLRLMRTLLTFALVLPLSEISFAETASLDKLKSQTGQFKIEFMACAFQYRTADIQLGLPGASKTEGAATLKKADACAEKWRNALLDVIKSLRATYDTEPEKAAVVKNLYIQMNQIMTQAHTDKDPNTPFKLLNKIQTVLDAAILNLEY